MIQRHLHRAYSTGAFFAAVCFAGLAQGQPFGAVEDLDSSECENVAGEYGDACLVNPGETGVGKVIFDAPARRRLGTGNSNLVSPLAVVVMEADGEVPTEPVADAVVLTPGGIWVVGNNDPKAQWVNIVDAELQDEQNAEEVFPFLGSGIDSNASRLS